MSHTQDSDWNEILATKNSQPPPPGGGVPFDQNCKSIHKVTTYKDQNDVLPERGFFLGGVDIKL